MGNGPYRKLSADLIRGLMAKTNYLYFGDAEENTLGWSAFNTTFSGGVPGTITAGSTKLSLNRVITNVLKHSASFEMDITTAAASTGHGIISDEFTIFNEDLAKILEFACTYFVTTNPANLDFSGTSTQTLELWVYNVGLATWTQPTGFRGMNNKLTPDRVASQFQTDSSNASNKNKYRVAIIIRNDPTGTAKINFDSLSVFPRQRVIGPIVTDWQSYTPTGTFTTNTTYSGRWRRVGDSMEVQVELSFAGAPNSVQLGSITLPPGITIDTAKLINTTAQRNSLPEAQGNIYDSSANAWVNSLTAYWDSLTTIQPWYLVVTSASDGNTGAIINQAAPITFASGDKLYFSCKFPVVGWASSVQLSSDTDTREVSFRASDTTGVSLTTATETDAAFNTKIYDTHNGFSSPNYTIPVSGKYKLTGSARLNSVAWTTNQMLTIRFKKNGTTFSENRKEIHASNTLNVQHMHTDEYFFKAGDVVKMTLEQNSGSTVSTNSDANQNFFAIERLSGPSVVAESESIYAYGYASANRNPTTDAAIDYDTVVKDSHGAITTGSSWKFTAPVSRLYNVSIVNQNTGAVAATNFLYKNGVKQTQKPLVTNNSTDILSGSTDIYLNAGDYIHIGADNATVTHAANNSHFSIHGVK